MFMCYTTQSSVINSIYSGHNYSFSYKKAYDKQAQRHNNTYCSTGKCFLSVLCQVHQAQRNLSMLSSVIFDPLCQHTLLYRVLLR